MRLKLVSLVQADPVLAIYALEHLGENVPTKTGNAFYGDMIRRAAQQINEDLLRRMLSKDPARQLTPQQIARLEKLWGKRADDLKNLIPIAQSLVEADIATVRSQLGSNNPEVRKLTIQIIARKRLPLESELIDLLKDPTVGVQAHEALIRVARGIDFGPFPLDPKHRLDRTVKKWRHWLALQQEAIAASEKGVAENRASKPNQASALEPGRFLLETGDLESVKQRREVMRLCDELVNAKTEEQRSLLARMRDAEGIDNTDALALAIPKLPDSLREEAEDVLAQRLTRMKIATLRDKLQDDQMEVRRAAAFACARKLANELIPDLVQLLDDPEKDVIQAARAALTELTGEDFGPGKDADRRARIDAVAAWRKWCKQRAAAPK